ncbi:hypothetical protein WJX84_002570 [Apatococcus fuscideae]|uniref:Uncharacterized protein n=1 Tax=Apatococcus fuscideae TaxID=2026836 RepID=A0AAW1SY03_9CHLO
METPANLCMTGPDYKSGWELEKQWDEEQKAERDRKLAKWNAETTNGIFNVAHDIAAKSKARKKKPKEDL